MPTIITETFRPEQTVLQAGIMSRYASTRQTFPDIRSSAGTSASQNAAGGYLSTINSTSSTNMYDEMSRGVLPFDTSTLPDDAVLVRATFYTKVHTVSNNLVDAELHLCESSAVDPTAVVASDFQNYGDVSFGHISYADLLDSKNTGSYASVELNGDGLAFINKTGITPIGTRLRNDMLNITPTWISGVATSVYLYSTSDVSSGYFYDPDPYYLDVEYYLPRDAETLPHYPMYVQNDGDFQRGHYTKIWDGSSWVYSKPRMYNGREWEDLL